MAGVGEMLGGTFGSLIGAKRNLKAAKADRATRLKMINDFSYQPMYASDTTPTYQRTQSPVARSYLESFLSGSNPDATFSGAPNAGYQKAQAQLAQNRQYGTPDERIAAQQQINTATPWAVTSPTRSIKQDQADAADRAKYSDLLQPSSGMSMTNDERKKLVQYGYLNPESKQFRNIAAQVGGFEALSRMRKGQPIKYAFGKG